MNKKEEKLSHLYQLYQLAIEDGVLSQIELAFIKNIAERLEIDLEEVEKYKPHPNKLILPDQEYKIIPLFHRLTLLMCIDTVATESEKDFCFQMGIRMGLHPQAVTETIGLIIEYGTSLTPESITEVFNKFSN